METDRVAPSGPARELVLLSPYRLPAQHPLTLADDDMAGWLQAYSALWHPAALWQAAGPPRVDSPYDHEAPRPKHVYALPSSPANMVPEHWASQAASAGAAVFRAEPDRQATRAALLTALAPADETARKLTELPAETVAPFFGIGIGYLLLATLCEAMDHENLLQVETFWSAVQRAVASAAGLPENDSVAPPESAASTPAETAEHGNPQPYQQPIGPEPAPFVKHLQEAARQVLSARETLYPVAIHWLNVAILGGATQKMLWSSACLGAQPINLIASAASLEALNADHPEKIEELKERIRTEQVEVCGGIYLERPEPFLPVESQWWNLAKGIAVSRDILGADIKVFAREQFGAHPQLPTWLNPFGINRAVLLPLAEAAMPEYNSPIISWSMPDGRSLDCFVRKPMAADSADTFFNLGHRLFKTTREDHTATLVFQQGSRAALPWFGDLLELAKLAPVLGQWSTFSQYFGAAGAGEYVGPLVPDDFHFDFLSERAAPEHAGDAVVPPTMQHSHRAVSGFARHLRLRRRLDAAWTIASIYRGLTGRDDLAAHEQLLRHVEDEVERQAAGPGEAPDRLQLVENQLAEALAARLLARAPENQPGYLVLNPCSFTRRVALELPARGAAVPCADPVKASQVAGEMLRVVVEVPPLGFAWLAQAGPPGSAPPSRMKLADDHSVRNEFFEAEIDPATGGLRSIRDHKSMLNRIAQRLVFRPGSTMRATSLTTTSTGPALGELVSEGNILGPQGQALANFKQRFRAWLGRPLLDLRIEIVPLQHPAGSPWQAYFGAQFAWRDERALVLRGLGGMSHVTTHLRPQTPDFLEIRLARQSTTIFTGGLPFHQREGGRMVDVILVPPGETEQVFDLALGLDREQPMQTALGLVTPVLVVPATKGPPHVGPKGWLFHLDASNILLTSLRPGSIGPGDGTAPADSITARVLECAGTSTAAELHCVRAPKRVVMVDARGAVVAEGSASGDAALMHIGPGEWAHLRVDF
jgi:hypothetical protein